MGQRKWFTAACSVILVTSILSACSGGNGGSQPSQDRKDPAPQTPVADNKPFEISIALQQVNDIPAEGNPIQKAIEAYTNTKLNIQWLPNASFDEKVTVMIASNELPMIFKMFYNPTTVGAVQSGMFWEVGPLLKDYKNLAAQNPQYYKNIEIDGKVYGIPNYREIGREAVIFRKDWMDGLSLKPPKSLDEFYEVIKAFTLNDPDKNGKNDTFGLMLHKKSFVGTTTLQTRLSVSQGGPNIWEVSPAGKFTPEFETQPYNDVRKFLRKLYAENLINQDFPALDSSEADKVFEAGRVGMKLDGVATNAANILDRLSKAVPTAQMDIAHWEGPKGKRVKGQSGNNGFLAFPKSAVKTEADLKKVLTFLDKLLDPDMSTLQKRGIEGVHHVKTSDGKMVEWKDLTAFNREVKPYRDNLLNFETYNVPPLKDSELAMKGYAMEPAGLQYAIANPALTLANATYSSRGGELEIIISDALAKFVIGSIDENGWNDAVKKWHQSGGDQMIKEYEEAYAKVNKK
jgi:putative aldouronate transport system substrate-binding protein